MVVKKKYFFRQGWGGARMTPHSCIVGVGGQNDSIMVVNLLDLLYFKKVNLGGI